MKALTALRPNAWLAWAAILTGSSAGLMLGYSREHAVIWWFRLIAFAITSICFALTVLDVYTRRTRSDGDAVGLDLQSAQHSPIRPPGVAEWFVALIVPMRRSDGVLGDLEERFHRHVETRGLRRARWLYWAEALQSIAPILWTKAKRLGMIAAIAEIWRRFHS
jgi:hypothetical protein